jgi:hypothetical protein
MSRRADTMCRVALLRLNVAILLPRRATSLLYGRQRTRKTPPDRGFYLERMMGLEPTTFCMANASDRSLLFAPVRPNRLFAGLPSQATERERTPSLAILATASVAES